MIGLSSCLIRERLMKIYALDRFPSDSVQSLLDIGGNVSVFSTQARFKFPSARIVAVEPDPANAKAFRTNVDGLNIEVIEAGLGRGKPLECRNPGQRNATLVYAETQKEGGVRSLTLPQMFAEAKLNPLQTFIKCDCEGAELTLIDDPEAEKILLACVGWGFEIHSRDGIARFGRWMVDKFSRNMVITFMHCTHTGFGLAMRRDIWERTL